LVFSNEIQVWVFIDLTGYTDKVDMTWKWHTHPLLHFVGYGKVGKHARMSRKRRSGKRYSGKSEQVSERGGQRKRESEL